MTLLSKLSTTALTLAVLCGLAATAYWTTYWIGTPTTQTIFNALVWTAIGLSLTALGAGIQKADNRRA